MEGLGLVIMEGKFATFECISFCDLYMIYYCRSNEVQEGLNVDHGFLYLVAGYRAIAGVVFLDFIIC